MTPFEVREIVGRLRAAFPDPPMSEETEAIYSRMLADLDYAQLDVVVDNLILTMMKLPTISRIRRAVIEPTLELPTAEEAWVAIQSRTPDMHPLAARAATLMGGSFNLRTSDDPELTQVRFTKVYDQLVRRVVDAALTREQRRHRMKLPAAS